MSRVSFCVLSLVIPNPPSDFGGRQGSRLPEEVYLC
jgi:hypothetical protein